MLICNESTFLYFDSIKRLCISRRKKHLSLIIAKSETVSGDVGYAILYGDELETIDEAEFAKLGAMNLFGARTILRGYAFCLERR